MRYVALACDYDGTLASEGKVDARTVEAMEKLLAFTPDSQVTTLLAFPSDVAANAFAIAVCQGGLVTNFRMTPLIPWNSAMAAMARAKAASDKKAFPTGWS